MMFQMPVSLFIHPRDTEYLGCALPKICSEYVNEQMQNLKSHESSGSSGYGEGENRDKIIKIQSELREHGLCQGLFGKAS